MSNQRLDSYQHAIDQEELFKELLMIAYRLDNKGFGSHVQQLKNKIPEITSEELRQRALNKMLEDSVTWVEEGVEL